MTARVYDKIVFRDDRAELITEELPALGNGQVLVKTSCSLISPGTERSALTRLWDDAWFRDNPGYALAWEVIEVGKDVANGRHLDAALSRVKCLSIDKRSPHC